MVDADVDDEGDAAALLSEAVVPLFWPPEEQKSLYHVCNFVRSSAFVQVSAHVPSAELWSWVINDDWQKQET